MFILTGLFAESEVVAAEVDVPLDFFQVLVVIFPHFLCLARGRVDLSKDGLQHLLRGGDEFLEPQFNFLHELRGGVKKKLAVIDLLDQ